MKAEQLRFLTRSYHDLQGLRLVPIGAVLAGWELARSGWPGGNSREVVQLALVVAAVVGFLLIGQYYENRFGRVQQNVGPGLLAGVVLGLILIAGFVATERLDTTDPPVSIASVFFACVFAGALISSRGRRWYFLLPVVAFVVLAVLPMAGVAAAASVDERPLNITLGLTLVFTGVLDHLLLVRSMPEPADV